MDRHWFSTATRFSSKDQIISRHELWSSDAAAWYLGPEGTEYFPGRIDPDRIVVIERGGDRLIAAVHAVIHVEVSCADCGRVLSVRQVYSAIRSLAR